MVLMTFSLSDVRQAIESGSVVPCFQPQVELRTGRLAGVEVLARWRHPDHGLILPQGFISLAEENGLIGLLTEQILRSAFLSATVLPHPLAVAVNLSPIQLGDRSLPSLIRAAAAETGFPLQRLTIEITESALVTNLECARSIAIELKSMGCRLALDDFGTGYSSLQHLEALPFSELKIDRSFVESMTFRRESRKIVAAVIGLGSSLDMMTVAEGVETQEQADMLLYLGCELGQGWLYGRPVPGEQLPGVVAGSPWPLSTKMSPQGSEIISSLEALPAQRFAQLQAIYDGAPVGLCFLDRNLRYVSLNQRLADLNRAPVSAHVGRKVQEMIPELFPRVQPFLLRALQGEAIEGVEVSKPYKPGSPDTTLLLSYQPAVDEAREVVGISVAIVDITERKRNEEAQSRLAAIVESSQEAIVGNDLKGIVTSWNKGAEKIFGYRADELIGQSIRRLLPPGRESEVDETLERVRHGETIELLESERQRKDGRTIQVSLIIAPIRDSSNRIVGVSKIAREVTEKKLLERQLRQSQKMEAIGQLTGGIAHDFNNLLTVVIGNLSLMATMIDGNEAAMRRLKPAQKAAARGAELIRRLLALASKEDLNPANIRIDDAVQETIELAGRALGPEIKIVASFDPSVPPVYADAAGLESALLNLAVNARDAMPAGGTLSFHTQLSNLDGSFPAVKAGELEAGLYARISVSDTGHGMSKETLERALDPFFTTKARDKGTGLGLAMVYGFARQSGGTIHLYSEPGHGTTVSVYLPVAREPAPTSADVPEELLASHPGKTILVVDDEQDLLEIAHTYLNRMGHSTLRADNAASALNVLAQYKQIDLMLTDIIMPGGMNGVELAKQARQLNPKLKVIYSSGFPADALAERSGTTVDAPMLRKPYHSAEFSSIIERALEVATT
jgi:PAS domain S-box-containing protein